MADEAVTVLTKEIEALKEKAGAGEDVAETLAAKEAELAKLQAPAAEPAAAEPAAAEPAAAEPAAAEPAAES